MKNEFKCLNPQRVPLSSPQRGAMTERTYDYYGASGVIDKVEDFGHDGVSRETPFGAMRAGVPARATPARMGDSESGAKSIHKMFFAT